MDGQQFKSARSILGLTQKALADELDVSEVTIQNYENDRSTVPLTVILALEALANRQLAEQATARDRFLAAARRYARAFVNQNHDEMAQVWASELSPRIQAANVKEHAELRGLVEKEVFAASRALRVYEAALRHKGHLILARNEAPGLWKAALDELLEQIG